MFIGIGYTNNSITGNVVGISDFGFFDFLHGMAFASSAVGLLMGLVFLRYSKNS